MCRTKRKKNGPEKLLGHGDSMGDMIDPLLEEETGTLLVLLYPESVTGYTQLVRENAGR